MEASDFLVPVLLVACTVLVLTLLALAILGRHAPAPERAKMRSWRIVLPRSPQFSAAQSAAFFGSLAPLLTGDGPPLLVELRGERRAVELRLSAAAAWEAQLRSQLAAWFPGARLEPLPADGPAATGTGGVRLPLGLGKPDVYPLRIPPDAGPDPLLGVFGLLTQADLPLALQIECTPLPRDWASWAPAALASVRAGRKPPPRGWLLGVTQGLQWVRGAPAAAAGGAEPDPEGRERIEAKLREPLLGSRLTLWAGGEDRQGAEHRCRELGTYLQAAYRDPFGNFPVPATRPLPAGRQSARAGAPVVLSVQELAALFHVPGPDHPLVPGAGSRWVPPPASLLLPEQTPFTLLGEALHAERRVPFGLALADRYHHTYVVGKTGTGKSTLLATLLRQDLEAGRGVALIDPHGDLAELALALVPPERAGELLYFHPADFDFPVGFNPLAASSRALRPLVASGVVSAFKKLFGDSWGPRLEYFLRNALLALLETPSPSLLLLPRLLTDRGFRAGVLQHVRDPLLRSFFLEEYERYEPRWRAEAISPILNKVGQFLSSPVVRHVVGQSGPGFHLRELMDRRGIFIANLASGRIGEDNTGLLGALLVSAFQLAAMSRADVPEPQREPFFLCVDEFQHFATEAFAQVLSEARKYRLALTLSHQYLEQLPPAISEAVFGNAGSLCVFRVGAADSARLAQELAPAFDRQDLVRLDNHHFCVRMTRGGEVVPPFSAQTVPLPTALRDVSRLLTASRQRWAQPRVQVELEIADQWEGRLQG